MQARGSYIEQSARIDRLVNKYRVGANIRCIVMTGLQ